MARFADIILHHLETCDNAAHVAAFRTPVGVEGPVIQIVKGIAAFADQIDMTGETIQGSFRFHDLLDTFAALIIIRPLGGRLSAHLLGLLIDELKTEADK